MIVAPRFDGDQDEDLMRAQHDVYCRALSILVKGCEQKWRDAEALLDVSTELGAAITRAEFDHHVVQDAHDLLAAIWRVSNGLTHPRLKGLTPDIDALIHDWLSWLGAWVAQAANVRDVRAILKLAYTDPDAEYSEEHYLLPRLQYLLDQAIKNKAQYADGHCDK